MAYKVTFKPVAFRDLERLPPQTKRRIALAVEDLSTNPRPHSSKKLRAKEDWFRIRVGDYRIIYHVSDKDQEITILRIRHRRDVYKGI